MAGRAPKRRIWPGRDIFECLEKSVSVAGRKVNHGGFATISAPVLGRLGPRMKLLSAAGRRVRKQRPAYPRSHLLGRDSLNPHVLFSTFRGRFTHPYLVRRLWIALTDRRSGIRQCATRESPRPSWDDPWAWAAQNATANRMVPTATSREPYTACIRSSMGFRVFPLQRKTVQSVIEGNGVSMRKVPHSSTGGSLSRGS